MEGMTFLGFVLIVMAGVSLLALILELLNPERQRSAREQRTSASEGALAAESIVAAMPAFFGKAQGGQLPLATPGFDDALLAVLQNHVKAERAMANEFVHFPSIDRLYRQARPPLTMH